MEYPKYVQINDHDLALAIRQGMHPMTEWFDPAHDHLPYFYNRINGNEYGNCHHPSYSAVHTMGRWLEALTAASQTIGEPVSEAVIEKLRFWAFEIFNNPTDMPSNLDMKTFHSLPICDLHNLREAMYAFIGLLRINPDDAEAKKMALHLIQMVDTYTDFDTGLWKTEQYFRETGGRVVCGACTEDEGYRFASTLGRYISALVRLYAVFPAPQALLQAARLTKTCIDTILLKSGDFDAELFARHIHSTTSMLSGIAMFGDLTGDQAVLERVKAFFDRGFNRIALDIGWCLENNVRDDLVGEINNSCDLMEACLCLGRAGFGEYFTLAERMIRCHILPSQLLDVSFIPDLPSKDDARHHMAGRMKGAFGFPCPYGHEYKPGSIMFFNWDIVGGGVSGLCLAWREKVSYFNGIASINMLFDHEDESLRFISPYHNHGICRLLLKRPTTVRLRLSSRVKLNTVIPFLHCCLDGWLYLYDLPTDDMISIPLALLVEERTYIFRNHYLRFRFDGEHIVGAASEGKRLCFFPAL